MNGSSWIKPNEDYIVKETVEGSLQYLWYGDIQTITSLKNDLINERISA